MNDIDNSMLNRNIESESSLRRSTRQRERVRYYEPTFKGKSYQYTGYKEIKDENTNIKNINEIYEEEVVKN